MQSPTLATNLEVPSVRRRVLAMLYEAVLLFGVLFIGCYAYLALFQMRYPMPAPQRWLFQSYVFLIIGIYFIWMWCHGGQTLAMRTWRFKLVNTHDGQNLRARAAMVRYLLAYPSVLLLFGIVWAYFDKDRQFLHDRMLHSRLVMCD